MIGIFLLEYYYWILLEYYNWNMLVALAWASNNNNNNNNKSMTKYSTTWQYFERLLNINRILTVTVSSTNRYLAFVTFNTIHNFILQFAYHMMILSLVIDIGMTVSVFSNCNCDLSWFRWMNMICILINWNRQSDAKCGE